MGRVRRYKKIKAIDPFAKRTKTVVNTSYDEPPENFYQRKAKKEKKLESFDDDFDMQIKKQEFQRLRTENTNPTSTVSKKIEGKRDDESMKKFKQRIRQETRVTLRDELQKLTKTSQKRKQRLKERKKKRKTNASASNSTYNEDVVHFYGEENDDKDDNGRNASSSHSNKSVVSGDEDRRFDSEEQSEPVPRRLRASDIGGPVAFAGAERIAFGEVAYRPPDIKQFNLKKRKRDEDSTKTMSKSTVSGSKPTGSGSGTNKQVANQFDHKSQSGIIHAGSGVAPSASEMELLRMRVQEAYRAVKEKRRAEGLVKM